VSSQYLGIVPSRSPEGKSCVGTQQRYGVKKAPSTRMSNLSVQQCWGTRCVDVRFPSRTCCFQSSFLHPTVQTNVQGARPLIDARFRLSKAKSTVQLKWPQSRSELADSDSTISSRSLGQLREWLKVDTLTVSWTTVQKPPNGPGARVLVMVVCCCAAMLATLPWITYHDNNRSPLMGSAVLEHSERLLANWALGVYFGRLNSIPQAGPKSYT
jgi:hypothetical protein